MPTTCSFRTVGTVELVTELGAGAGSRVYRARRHSDGGEYALKVVSVATAEDHRFLDQLRNEYRVGALLDHPNLMKVFALDVESDWLFRPKRAGLLVEFVPGVTLDRAPPLSPVRLARVFARVADALDHMHGRGVCHADLKPNNLMLDPRRGVKVIDFGLSYVEGTAKARARGTPEYMAPETKARTHIDRRTDVFNLGATLYRLLTARHLPASPLGLVFDARSYRKQVVPVEALNPAAPRALCELVHRCVEYDPDRRPQTMAEVRAALGTVAAAHNSDNRP